jgi:hypothetical protein
LRFTCVDVGAYGRDSDGGVFSRSSFGKAALQNSFNFPSDAQLPDAPHLGPLPFVLVGDEAFPLRRNIIRPFPRRKTSMLQKQFNYRLSRARRIVENAFGILAARWRVYYCKIDVGVHVAKDLVKATLVLHSFLQSQTTPAQVTSLLQEVKGMRINGLRNLHAKGNRAAATAIEVRNRYAQYFVEQPLPWQRHHVQRGAVNAE